MRREWPYAGAGVLAVVALIESYGGDDPFALVLALAVTLPLALVRTHPIAATGSIATACALTSASGWPLPWAGLVALSAATVTIAVSAARRQWADRLRRKASQRAVANTLLEHAARAERARIARELHDVVAHHISMIAVQAEAARLTTPGMPDEGAKRLLAIGDTARMALTEMRRLLGVLREDAGAEPTRAPQPGLKQLNELLDESRALNAGGVRLIVSGTVAALDPGIELTAYRLVQEALTNARRHAPGAAVDVELHYGTEELLLRVRDNGPGSRGFGDGHGLNGMHERVAMVGGKLSAGCGSRGGFQIEATLPRGVQ